MNPPTLLLAVAADPQQAARARADGADLIDVRTATPGALAAIQASLPGAVLWTGPADAEPFDADLRPAGTGTRPAPAGSLPAVIAAAAIGTWLGVPVIHSRHTRAARRAIDMTLAITGTRPPARTIRGLA